MAFDTGSRQITRAGAAQAYAEAANAPTGSLQARARTASQKFEGVLVNNLMQSMFSGLTGEGPLGVNGLGGDTWRSMLVEQMSGSFVQAGGLGVAPQVYREMLRVQESQK